MCYISVARDHAIIGHYRNSRIFFFVCVQNDENSYANINIIRSESREIGEIFANENNANYGIFVGGAGHKCSDHEYYCTVALCFDPPIIIYNNIL